MKPTDEIKSVEFAQEAGGLKMIVSGYGFNPNDPEYYVPREALMGEYLKLNDSFVPLCAIEEQIEAIEQDLGEGVAAAGPTCFHLVLDDDLYSEQFILTQTQLTIWLPDDFDTEAEGTISIMDIPEFTFNKQSGDDGGGSDTETAPTAKVNGGKSLAGNPTISKRPTFSGTAEPGAHIKVEVHSDPVTCEITADAEGNWACTLDQDLAPGQHTVRVYVTPTGGGDAELLGPYTVTVAGDGSSQPVTSDDPALNAPNSGFAAPIVKWLAAGVAAMVAGAVSLLLVRRRFAKR